MHPNALEVPPHGPQPPRVSSAETLSDHTEVRSHLPSNGEPEPGTCNTPHARYNNWIVATEQITNLGA